MIQTPPPTPTLPVYSLVRSFMRQAFSPSSEQVIVIHYSEKLEVQRVEYDTLFNLLHNKEINPETIAPALKDMKVFVKPEISLVKMIDANGHGIPSSAFVLQATTLDYINQKVEQIKASYANRSYFETLVTVVNKFGNLREPHKSASANVGMAAPSIGESIN